MMNFKFLLLLVPYYSNGLVSQKTGRVVIHLVTAMLPLKTLMANRISKLDF
ncbi:hypothetical protein [Pedobacter sp. NJ-S-72]